MNDTTQPVHPWTWRDRLRNRLFPWKEVPLWETVGKFPPGTFKDVVVTRSRSELSFADRLRVLLTGKVEVETRIACENYTGQTKSASVLRAGRFF